jgi:hypothetical protein
MLMLAGTWGQARLGGLSNAQLIEWALKNWQTCEEEERKAGGKLIIDGKGADVTTDDQEAAARRLRGQG